MIMAKYELKFISHDNANCMISVEEDKGEICIKLEEDCDNSTIYLDKSTAIKFAKTLRTEINKITESEAING